MKTTTELDKEWYKSLYFADSGQGQDRIRTYVIQPKFMKNKVVEDLIKEWKKTYRQLRKDAVKVIRKSIKEEDFITLQLWVDYIIRIDTAAKVYRNMINKAKMQTYEDIIKLEVDWGDTPDRRLP